MNLKKWKEINLLFSSEGPFPMEGGSKEENEAVSFLQRNVNSFSDFFSLINMKSVQIWECFSKARDYDATWELYKI